MANLLLYPSVDGTRAKAKAKQRESRFHPLEARVPLFQLHFAHGQAMRLTGEVDLAWFNASIRRQLVDMRDKNPASPLAGTLLKTILRLEQTPLVSHGPVNPALEALLAQFTSEAWKPARRSMNRRFTARDFCAYLCEVLDWLQKVNTAGAASPRVTTLHNGPSHCWFKTRPLEWSVDNVLVHDGDFFGCLLFHKGPMPATPNTLLASELSCAMTLLRRRLDDPQGTGRRRETPHSLAPPALLLTVASDQVVEGSLWVRAVRVSFPDTVIPQADCNSNCREVVLAVEVGPTFDMSDSPWPEEWSDKDLAAWRDKVTNLLRPAMSIVAVTGDGHMEESLGNTGQLQEEARERLHGQGRRAKGTVVTRERDATPEDETSSEDGSGSSDKGSASEASGASSVKTTPRK